VTAQIKAPYLKAVKCFGMKKIGLLVSISILCVAYMRGVFLTTAWSDDYPIMVRQDHDISTPLIDGRPLFALLQFLSFSVVGENPKNLFILRAISLTALFGLFLLLIKYLGIRSRSEQVIIALGLCLPSFQWFVYWATIWSWSFPLLLSTIAWMMWKHDRKPRLLPIFMLTGAILIYPLNSLLPFALLAVKATYNKTEIRVLWKEFFDCLKLYGVGICVSVIVILLVFRINATSPSGKVSTIVNLSEIVEKLTWWATRPVTTAFRPFLIDSPSAAIAFFTMIPVVLVVFIGLFRQSLRMNENPFLRIATVMVFAAIPISPLLIVSQNQIDFRLTASWNLVIFLIFSFFISSWLNGYRKIRLLILSLVTVLVVIQSNENFLRTFEIPYSQKNTFLISSLQECDPTDDVIVILPKRSWPSQPLLGNFSTVSDLAHPWVLESNVNIIKRQIYPNLFSKTRLVYQPEKTDEELDRSLCTINLDQFVASISN
jgi:hypothetical protein